MVLSYWKAKKFSERLGAAKASGTLPDVIMPNGKKYDDCTRKEINGYIASMEEHAEAHKKTAWLAPLWTLLKIAIFAGIFYLYTSDKEMSRNANQGHIVLFAGLVAFGFAGLLAGAVYWSTYLYCRFARRGSTNGSAQTNDTDDDLGKLASEGVIEIGRGTGPWWLWWRDPNIVQGTSSIWSVHFSTLFFIAMAWGIALLIDDIRWRLVVGVVGTIVSLVTPGGLVSIFWLRSPRYRRQHRAYRRGGPLPGGPDLLEPIRNPRKQFHAWTSVSRDEAGAPRHLMRGFIRIWIVIAALWIAGNGLFAFTDSGIPSLTYHNCDELREFVVERTGKHLGDADVARCEQVWHTNRLTLLGWAFGPPFALLVVGVLLMWIGRGFRPKKSN